MAGSSTDNKFRDNVLALLAVFTFIIPVIPWGLVGAYNYLNSGSSTTRASTDYTEEEPSYPSSSDSTVPSIPSNYTESRGTYDCTSDCSGHDAGYDWGEEHEICDTDYDNGNSESFNEGVRAWAEDNC